jgi:tyrosine-protein kinase Etk/Wzc
MGDLGQNTDTRIQPLPARMKDSEIVSSPEPDSDSTTLLDLAIVVRRHARQLMIAPLLAGGIALGVSFLISPSFTSAAQILTPQQGQGSAAAALLGSLGGLAGAAGGLAGVKNPADQWVGLLESRTIGDALIQRFKLRELYDVDYQFQARKELDNNSTFTAGKNGLITIEVSDTSPQRAKEMAQAYIDELQKMSDQLAVTEAAQRRLFFEKQLRQAQANLVKAETALAESGVSAQVLKVNPEAAVGALAQLKAQITAQEVKLSVMRGSLTSASPELQQTERELSSLRAQLQKASLSDSGVGRGAEYIGRYREFKYQETLFDLLAKQYELAKVDEAKEGAVIQVVDAPSLPEWKSSPKRALIAAGAAVVALLGLLIYAFSRAAVEAMVNDPDNADRLKRWRSLRGQRA